MLRYTLRRLLGAIPTLLLVIVLAFLLVHAAPGGPFDSERALPPEIEANIAAAYNLDEPLPQQFVRYLGGLLRGDLGPSYSYRDYTVSELRDCTGSCHVYTDSSMTTIKENRPGPEHRISAGDF